MRYSEARFPFIISTQMRKPVSCTGETRESGEDVTHLIRNNEKKLSEILTKMVFLESSLDEILEKEEQDNESFFQSLIPVMDNLDAACRSAAESEDSKKSGNPGLARGLEIIKRKLLQLLFSRGFIPSAEIGMKFNPRFHEALGTVSNSGEPDIVESELISDIVLQGWMLNDKVLRFAKVMITS